MDLFQFYLSQSYLVPKHVFDCLSLVLFCGSVLDRRLGDSFTFIYCIYDTLIRKRENNSHSFPFHSSVYLVVISNSIL